jgi:hypothetical protein
VAIAILAVARGVRLLSPSKPAIRSRWLSAAAEFDPLVFTDVSIVLDCLAI